MRRYAFLLLGLSFAAIADDTLLPPVLPWSGASERLLDGVPAEWISPVERMRFDATPNYDDSMAFLRRIDDATDIVRVHEFGRSPEGRALVVAIASRDAATTLATRTDKIRVLIQAGIHAGEIDGKDAGLMLLRDFARGEKLELLDHADLYFVPMFNPDGHERRDAEARINQRGPKRMGWRTTARNLNLNRDYMKADSVEMHAMLKLIGALDPQLYVDLHVTDGIDYQYDITYGWNDRHPHSPHSARWLDGALRPALDAALSKQGHVPGPLVFANNNLDLSEGLDGSGAPPRFQTGYGDLRHVPTVLVENHSLKPYRQRVLGTYVLVETLLRTAGAQAGALRQAIAQDRASRRATIGFNVVKAPEQQYVERGFKAIASERYASDVLGANSVRWLGKPITIDVPKIPSKFAIALQRPRAYWVPAAWSDVIAKLELHGIAIERQQSAVTREVELYRLPDAKLAAKAFEGRVTVTSGTPVVEKQTRTFAPGSVRVPTDQPLGDLAIALLEPQHEDSLYAWGDFIETLSATEYAEAYVVEPLAQRMLKDDPKLRAAFDEALKDPAFAADPDARLQWFYARSGFADREHMLYPVGIER